MSRVGSSPVGRGTKISRSEKEPFAQPQSGYSGETVSGFVICKGVSNSTRFKLLGAIKCRRVYTISKYLRVGKKACGEEESSRDSQTVAKSTS
jgi:hypothetical protein